MNYKDINTNKLNQILKNNKDIVLLDVRSEEEFEYKHIEGAINLPISDIYYNMDEIEDYKEKEIIVYCRSGHRSITVCNLLSMEGFENLYNLDKGNKTVTINLSKSIKIN